MILSIHAGSTVVSAFLASSVEAVEALTVVLAVGVVRGWRQALLGTAIALCLLVALVAIFGQALGEVPVALLQTVVGVLLLLFGMRWLRKAMLRSAGVIRFHDEAAIYQKEIDELAGHDINSSDSSVTRWDAIAIATTFKAVTLEGVEVIAIVIALGSVQGLLVPAGLGALAACLLVATAGLVLHRPLARVPENALKFAVGILMSSFGLFWFGAGIGIRWPYADAAIPGLAAILTVASWSGVGMAKRMRIKASRVPSLDGGTG